MQYLWFLLVFFFATPAIAQVSVLHPVAVINAAPLASTVTSSAVHIMYLDNVGIQFVWTGTPTCTLNVLVSNQTTVGSNPPTPVSGSFTALTLTGVTNPAGGSGTFWIDLNQLGAEWVEAQYASCSGSGTLSAYLSAKGV
jgi:hypothetical protein